MSDTDHSVLGSNERARLTALRDWVKGHFAEAADQKYEPIDGKLRLIRTILANGWVNPDETWKLQALGVAFGDAIAQKLQMDWVTVDDEFGRDPALNWPGTTVLSYPITMISKRIERGENVDTHELFDHVCLDLSEMAQSGRYKLQSEREL